MQAVRFYIQEETTVGVTALCATAITAAASFTSIGAGGAIATATIPWGR